MDDRDLAGRLRECDPKATEAALIHHMQKARSYLQRRVRTGRLTPQDVEGVEHDILIEFYEGTDRFDASRSPLRHYLYLRAKTHARARARAFRNRRSLADAHIDALEAHLDTAHRPSPEAIHRLMHHMNGRMQPKERLLLSELVRNPSITMAELADVCRTTLGGVYKLRSTSFSKVRAHPELRRRIRELLSNED